MQRHMPRLPANLYARWRSQHAPALALHEAAGGGPPPERLLQQIWWHQRLQRDRLRTFDGRRLQVLHPGFPNREAGPDFRQALLQFDTDPPVCGDVEVDIQPGGWRGHRHDDNPAYRQVALHVVWDGDPAAKPPLPTLALRDVLDASVSELAHWLGEEAGAWPDELAGKCRAPLRELNAVHAGELLEQAARLRLQAKAAALLARARQAGADQALWEGLFSALGYKHNVWPMRRLAELRPQLTAAGDAAPALAWQARLLGVGGLLPAEPPRRDGPGAKYFRALWDCWWRERDGFSEWLLPRHAWRLAGIRPANHPQRRLALAAHWLARADLPGELEGWFTAMPPAAAARQSLLRLLQAQQDTFWSWHWTLRSAPLAKPQPLLGAARVTDLAMNVILPWFWMRADSGHNEELKRRVEAAYLAWPAGEDNAVLRQARQRLLGGARLQLFRTAARQQGLLQIVRDFCAQSNALCEGCRFPELVRGLAVGQASRRPEGPMGEGTPSG